jgi:ABC-type tungstate transport system permease subunit
VLVDGSGSVHGVWVARSAARFEHDRGRAVRVLLVDRAIDALQLARRGEADVAVVPESAPLEDFVTAGHGSEAGRLDHEGAMLRVLAVDAAQHPKIDGPGAKALAGYLVGDPDAGPGRM